MQGWSIEAYRLGTGAIVPYGPAAYEGSGSPWNSKDNGTGEDLGRGGFYATCDYNQGGAGTTPADKTPSTVWLGTDQLANGQSLVGIKLSQITRLTYYAFTDLNPWRLYTGAVWDDMSSWRCARQPIMVALTAVDPTGGDRRTWYCRPWGSKTVGDDNYSSWIQWGGTKGRWEYHDCLQIGRVPGPAWGTWWDPWSNTRKSWADIIAMFGEYTLAPTSNDPYPTGFKSPGWDDQTDPAGTPQTVNGTGKCLNLMVGGRKRNLKFPEDSTNSNVYLEAAGGRFCADMLTIGIDGVDTTFNFEPAAEDPVPWKVFATGQSISDYLSRKGDTVATYNPLQRGTEDRFLFTAMGKVVLHDKYQFTLDTPNPLPYQASNGNWYNGIRISTWPDEHGFWGGETVSATGYVERLRFKTNVPFMMWTDMNHIKVQATPS